MRSSSAFNRSSDSFCFTRSASHWRKREFNVDFCRRPTRQRRRRAPPVRPGGRVDAGLHSPAGRAVRIGAGQASEWMGLCRWAVFLDDVAHGRRGGQEPRSGRREDGHEQARAKQNSPESDVWLRDKGTALRSSVRMGCCLPSAKFIPRRVVARVCRLGRRG